MDYYLSKFLINITLKKVDISSHGNTDICLHLVTFLSYWHDSI